MNNYKRILLLISRGIVSIVFLFSGFVKGIDPFGSTYKFVDYFAAFRIGFLEPVALPLAILLSTAEFIIGVSVLLGLRFKIGAWAAFLLISFFTALTFFLALTNPVSDCGCFGDAIVLTNWQTFYKNLILLPFVILIFYYRNAIHSGYNLVTDWSLTGVFTVLFFVLEIYSLRHLPPLDFRPYSVGTYIPDKMIIPDGAPQDIYKIFLYYEKDGQIKEFTEENFPWQDTAWVFVEAKHVLVEKGYEPPIQDFTIVNADGIDFTDMVLEDGSYSMLLISDNLTKADPEALLKANELAVACSMNDCSFYCLTSSADPEIKKISEDLDLTFQFYTTDEATLKTIIRSNPGLILLSKGLILAKLHYHDFPEPAELENNLMATILTDDRISSEKLKGVLLLFVFISIILLIQLIFPHKIRL